MVNKDVYINAPQIQQPLTGECSTPFKVKLYDLCPIGDKIVGT